MWPKAFSKTPVRGLEGSAMAVTHRFSSCKSLQTSEVAQIKSSTAAVQTRVGPDYLVPPALAFASPLVIQNLCSGLCLRCMHAPAGEASQSVVPLAGRFMFPLQLTSLFDASGNLVLTGKSIKASEVRQLKDALAPLYWL